MKILIPLLILLGVNCCVCDTIDSASCNADKCYRSVNTTYHNLLDLIRRFNATTTSAKLPYDDAHLKNLTKELENVQKRRKKIQSKLINSNTTLNEIKENITDNQNSIDQMRNKLLNISHTNAAANELNDILTQANDQYEKFKELVSLKRNVSETCKVAKDKFVEFEKDIKNITKSYNEIEKDYNEFESNSNKLRKEFNETGLETVKTKNNFEQLKLPNNVLENYVNETVANLHSSISYLENNTDLLTELLNATNKQIGDQISQQNEAVEKTLSQIEGDLDVMNKNIQKYENAFIDYGFNATVNDETIELIKLIREEITALENKMKSLDFSDEEKELLNMDYENVDVIREKRNKLKKYRLLLDAIPASDEKLQEIESELTRFKITISLLQQLEKLKEESEHLRELRDEYLQMKCPQEELLT